MDLRLPDYIGFGIGLVGILIGIYFYVRQTKPKSAIYKVASSIIIDKQTRIRGLSVALNNVTIQGHLIYSEISLWNRGIGTIDGKDIAAGDPLRIQAGDGVEILDVWLTSPDNPACQFTVKKRVDGTIGILFDYMDKGDGATIGMFRTTPVETIADKDIGTLNEELSLIGHVKGARIAEYKSDRVRALSAIFDPTFGNLLKLLEPLPKWTEGPVTILVFLPLFLASLPILGPFIAVDTIRNRLNSPTDGPHTK